MNSQAGEPPLDDSRGFIAALVGDGRPLIKLAGVALILSGVFAIFQSWTGHFLPHDVAYLQMSVGELCGINECRIVHFMFHDRISFGGAIIAIGVLYLWLAEFPLLAGERWAWWALAASGVSGFGSFLTYLGYGYLDTLHGAATLALLPCFAVGLWRSRPLPRSATSSSDETRSLWRSVVETNWRSQAGAGRACLLLTAAGMVGAGTTIQLIGMTTVFVETDLAYMELTRDHLNAINPRLIPLIAHDRAGFGGGVITAGVLLGACVWFSPMTRSLWQALWLAGIAGWTTAIGVHPAIGYVDPLHLTPAVGGAFLFVLGMCLSK
jgi:hypothetical protein